MTELTVVALRKTDTETAGPGSVSITLAEGTPYRLVDRARGGFVGGTRPITIHAGNARILMQGPAESPVPMLARRVPHLASWPPRCRRIQRAATRALISSRIARWHRLGAALVLIPPLTHLGVRAVGLVLFFASNRRVGVG